MAKITSGTISSAIFQLRSGQIDNVAAANIANDKELIVKIDPTSVIIEGETKIRNIPKVYLGNDEFGDANTKLYGIVMDHELEKYEVTYEGSITPGTPPVEDIIDPAGTIPADEEYSLVYTGPIGKNDITGEIVNIKGDYVVKIGDSDYEAGTFSVQFCGDGSSPDRVALTKEFSTNGELYGELYPAISFEKVTIVSGEEEKDFLVVNGASPSSAATSWKVKITSITKL